ncbi:hypothetical protein ACLOJK_037636 [Asimina triloba]
METLGLVQLLSFLESKRARNRIPKRNEKQTSGESFSLQRRLPPCSRSIRWKQAMIWTLPFLSHFLCFLASSCCYLSSSSAVKPFFSGEGSEDVGEAKTRKSLPLLSSDGVGQRKILPSLSFCGRVKESVKSRRKKVMSMCAWQQANGGYAARWNGFRLSLGVERLGLGTPIWVVLPPSATSMPDHHLSSFLDTTDIVRNHCKKMPPPLVALLSSEPEIQYAALRNINLILQRRLTILAHEILCITKTVFFCKLNDPIYVKMEKLETMIKLASDRNIDQILSERLSVLLVTVLSSWREQLSDADISTLASVYHKPPEAFVTRVKTAVQKHDDEEYHVEIEPGYSESAAHVVDSAATAPSSGAASQSMARQAEILTPAAAIPVPDLLGDLIGLDGDIVPVDQPTTNFGYWTSAGVMPFSYGPTAATWNISKDSSANGAIPECLSRTSKLASSSGSEKQLQPRTLNTLSNTNPGAYMTASLKSGHMTYQQMEGNERLKLEMGLATKWL